MSEFLNYEFLGNTVYIYLNALVIFIVGLLAVKIFRKIILKNLVALSAKTKTSFDDFLIDLIKRIVVPLAYFGIFYLALNSLNMIAIAKKSVDITAFAIITICAARVLSLLVKYSCDKYLEKHKKSSSLERSFDVVLKIARIIIWSVAIIIFLDNIGFKISTVVAGLGIGGVAVGLAAQAVLKDLFSYFSIIFDTPFEVGDFIIVGDYMGVVEKIGAKTTRIRSLGGEQLVFSNTDLTDSRVRNYKRMQKRRVVFKVGVTYQTTLAQTKEIPNILKEAVTSTAETTFDRAHFFSYGDFSLIYEIVYYVNTGDYNKYMDVQQEINFKIKEEFEKRNIEFAYPTQTLFISKEG